MKRNAGAMRGGLSLSKRAKQKGGGGLHQAKLRDLEVGACVNARVDALGNGIGERHVADARRYGLGCRRAEEVEIWP